MKRHILYSTLIFVIILCSHCAKGKTFESQSLVQEDTVPAAVVASVKETKLFDTVYHSGEGYKFSIQEIDSVKFTSLCSKYHRKEQAPERITDRDSVTSMLQGRVQFDATDEETLLVEKIYFANGTSKSLEDSFEGLFVAYFPDYDFLYLEGGHSCDDGYNLKTGEDIYTTGNPADQTLSPARRYRISGVFGGQECSTYIIQKYTDGRLKKIGEIDHPDLCYFNRSFWENDTAFYFSMRSFMNDSQNGEMQYYKMTINEK